MDKQHEHIFARLNHFLENKFKISFSNMSVRKFSKKITKMIVKEFS